MLNWSKTLIEIIYETYSVQKILRVNSSYYNTKSKLVCHQQNIAPLVTYIQIEQELSWLILIVQFNMYGWMWMIYSTQASQGLFALSMIQIPRLLLWRVVIKSWIEETRTTNVDSNKHRDTCDHSKPKQRRFCPKHVLQHFITIQPKHHIKKDINMIDN